VRVGSLEIPSELVALVESGVWPRTHKEAEWQNVSPIITPESVRAFAPEESQLFLYPPPFHTVADDLAKGKGLTAVQHAVWDIEPSLTVLIADFGLGSDAALTLDYRASTTHPQVLRLQWQWPSSANRWLRVAESFVEFWTMLTVQTERPRVGA